MHLIFKIAFNQELVLNHTNVGLLPQHSNSERLKPERMPISIGLSCFHLQKPMNHLNKKRKKERKRKNRENVHPFKMIVCVSVSFSLPLKIIVG